MYGTQSPRKRARPQSPLNSPFDQFTDEAVPKLTLEELAPYFKYTIIEAGKMLNCGVTNMKGLCRQLNINRWPKRKVRAMFL